jgi:aryl-alcohol dehydrogenase-like predicted oxidoreductase
MTSGRQPRIERVALAGPQCYRLAAPAYRKLASEHHVDALTSPDRVPAAVERFALAPDLTICRILNGMWQVSGGHGRIERERAIGSMAAYVDAGFTTWDLADHYGPAEDFVGAFRRQYGAARGAQALADLQFCTKWVPRPAPMRRDVVDAAVATSRRRMATETLDLLQFHWWDYGDRRYIDALAHLAALSESGAVRHLALTNFDTERTAAILDTGIPIVSNQVQFSLIDRRPEARLALLCRERGLHLLAYGTVCGGLLSEQYFGRPEPRGAALETVSLQKYKRMVDAWGGWALFQELLAALNDIATRHGVGIATVAVRWVLDRPAVAGAILGRRLGLTDHRADGARVFALRLDAEDHARIDAVLAKSRDLLRVIGDCGDEYR